MRTILSNDPKIDDELGPNLRFCKYFCQCFGEKWRSQLELQPLTQKKIIILNIVFLENREVSWAKSQKC
jgi:hypothetical protein